MKKVPIVHENLNSMVNLKAQVIRSVCECKYIHRFSQSIGPCALQISEVKQLIMSLKEPSPIFSTFFPTFGDFGVDRKLIFSHNPCKLSCLKSVSFGRDY